MKDYLRLHDSDHVVVALRHLKAGDFIEIAGQRIVLRSDIAFGHKAAIRSVAAGEPVLKYGLPIGIATKPIQAGDHVHVHNIISGYLPEKD